MPSSLLVSPAQQGECPCIFICHHTKELLRMWVAVPSAGAGAVTCHTKVMKKNMKWADCRDRMCGFQSYLTAVGFQAT